MKSMLRYGVVGVFTNLLGYLTYLILTYWSIDYKISMTLLYILGSIIGFFCNKGWAFEYCGFTWLSMLRYYIAHFLGYILNLGLLIIFSDKLGYPHQAVQAVAIIIVAGFLYMVLKLFVFRKNKIHKVVA
ncbi:GtrA family protein [Endozoicomonas sp. SM1973]|uniref:GtrA family protein n=1 Tax=Spartinivicinus marinus TaxID=2994442 RepID=A0A853ICI5_9GAMM|nr:GtrA family protein [Spartinivicinus marinus]MCX4028816.1 GtrA family protein [Spartinivicinus marinus]NYZ67631.1 GtrA family protein [Spartinivicinus marinus]